jgi:hypothetical protein
MELNFTELDNYNNQFETNYWVQSSIQKTNIEDQPIEKPLKKKVAFKDILSNMNLVVNKDGSLQSIVSNNQYPQQYPQQQYPKKNTVEPPIDRQSYIYNKYFKDYVKKIEPIIETRRPKTVEEYNQMILEDKLKAEMERKRVAEIKSTKLIFTNANNMTASRNTLNRMKFG